MKVKIRDQFQKFVQFDTLLNLIVLTYFFFKWVLAIWIYGYFFYLMFLILIIIFFLFSLVLELILVRRKVLYSIQLSVSFPLLFLYGLMFFISVACLPGVITFGLYLFLILLICKIIKIFTISKLYIESKKTGNSRRIKIKYLMKKKVWVSVFLVLFSLPVFVFIFGSIPNDVIGIDIDINEENSENGGSQSVQLSFYATLSSYKYLTDEKVLRILNGKTFGDEKSKPVEIILLIRESSLKNAAESRKLAYMVQSCTKHGIKIWVYFVYLPDNGYYPSYEDYEYLPKFKNIFDNWVNKHSLNIHGIIFDNEWDEDITNSWVNDDVFTFLKSLLQHRNNSKEGWGAATKMYEDIAEEWTDQGYRIALVGSEFALYDIIDKDPDLQQMFGILNYPPNIWKRVSYMLYRGCGTEEMGQDTLYLLSELHKKVYDERAVAALGCMGFYPYLTITNILEDVALLKFQGYSTIELFEFGAFYENFGYIGLLQVLEASISGWKYPKFHVRFTTTEFLARSFLLFADILLDLY